MEIRTEDRERWRALVAAVPRGPWHPWGPEVPQEAAMDLAAAATQAIPALLAEVEQLRAALSDKHLAQFVFAGRLVAKAVITVTAHEDGYVAHVTGVPGVVVGEGETALAALADGARALAFHAETIQEEADGNGE